MGGGGRGGGGGRTSNLEYSNILSRFFVVFNQKSLKNYLEYSLFEFRSKIFYVFGPGNSI